MSEQVCESKNVFTYKATADGCCDIYMASTDTDEVIEFPAEINGLRVTAIGYNGARGCKNVKTVIVPEGVTRIKSFAFCDCQNLVRIHVPSTLERVNRFTVNDWLSGNNAAVITCPKGASQSWQIEKNYLPEKRIVVTSSAEAGEKNEDGTVGIYTILPYETDLELLYQRTVFLSVEQYASDKADVALREVKQNYELILEKVQTYDVYSSDGVSPDDKDVSTSVLDLGPQNILFSKDGACCGIFYKDKNFNGLLFFDGTTLGTLTYLDRKLCYGHPLDYYIDTCYKLILRKK